MMSPYSPVDAVEVWCWDLLVGALVYDARVGVYAFEYSPQWNATGIELSPLHLRNRKGISVFPQLPNETFYGLPAMIADSLPDDFGNAVIDAWLATQGIDKKQISSLDRLAYAGERALGALTFHPAQPNLNGPATAIQIADIVDEARRLLADNSHRPHPTDEPLGQLIQVGSTAGGARAKAVIQFNPATSQIRSGYAEAEKGFQPWIIKLDGVSKSADGSKNSLDSPEQYTRIEYAYYLMAIEAGLTMSECYLLNEGPRAHFLTRRFDREADGEKIHLQSLCALDHLDFRQRDTHSYSQYFNALLMLGMGGDDLAQAFRRMVFNVAAVNRDDHTKNFAFLLPKAGSWRLAPAFDVTHSYNPQGHFTQRHQMSVNSKFEEIHVVDFEVLGDKYGVPNYRRIIKDVQSSVAEWLIFAAQVDVSTASSQGIAADMARFHP